MRSWKILDVKKFMNIMLCREAFDTLLLAEASITGGVSYVIDGHLTEDFYSEQELEEMGLDVPQITLLFQHLEQKGFHISDHKIYTVPYGAQKLLEYLHRPAGKGDPHAQ